MEWIAIIVQLALASVAIWYTIETRKLRIQNEAQMKLLREQTRLSLTPYLVPGIADVDLALLRKNIAEDKSLTEDQRKEKLSKLDEAKIKFVCNVHNPTSKTPHHVNVYIYDSRTRSFLEGDYGKEWIAEKGSELFQVSEPYLGRDEVVESIRKQYGDGTDFIFRQLSAGDQSYIAIIFRDLEGRLYMAKREFMISDGEAHHKPTALFFNI